MAKTPEPKLEPVIEPDLNEAFPAVWLRRTAEETRFVEREREIDPVVAFSSWGSASSSMAASPR